MKTPTKFLALVKEANEAANESSRLWRAWDDEEKESLRNGIEYDHYNSQAARAYSNHDHRAYAQIEGGKIICEATGATNGWTTYYKHCFYFLKDGATQRNRYSKAKALEALAD